ncbi:MAG: cystathionine beta-lyase [Mycobacterium sp.]|nr:cystathionine beta-lyase [Mycobacterium sp.]
MQSPGWLQAILGEPTPFDGLDARQLRRRRSYKWSAYPPDVLPAFVAEMDLPLSPAVTATLSAAVAAGDAGYAREDVLPIAFAKFAHQLWSWEVDPDCAVLMPDTMSGVARAIEILTDPGDGVVFTPAVYGPFARTIERLGRKPVEAPVGYAAGRWQLDLEAIDAALAAGARAVLLCNPHNPTGAIPTAAQLQALVDLAAHHGAGIVSDEVHGPLALPGQQFTPLLKLGPSRAITIFSASKAWNVPGLKCALAIGGDAATSRALNALANELRHPSHLGVLAAAAAFDGVACGDGWLEQVTRHLAVQHERARALLGELMPLIRPARADAGYLLWLDCRALNLGDAPATAFLERGRVALSPGLEFGTQGAGFARLNLGTSGPLLLEAVSRMQAALATPD